MICVYNFTGSFRCLNRSPSIPPIMRSVTASVDILVEREGKLLLGLLAEKWNPSGKLYGVPGREISFGETIGAACSRYIQRETGCTLTSYQVIAANANYAGGNHYVGIGVLAHIEGEPRVTLPDDWVEWKWFPKDKLPERLFDPAANIIKSYLEGKVNVME